MKQQKLLSLIRQAIEEYHMLEDGDRVAVGCSSEWLAMEILQLGFKRASPKGAVCPPPLLPLSHCQGEIPMPALCRLETN